MKIEHILLTTDLSEESRRCYSHAVGMAKANGARITLLNVVEDLKVAPHGAPLAPPLSDPEAAAHAAEAEQMLAVERDALGADAEVECKAVLGDSIGESIADFAKANGCDIILIATHGRSGFRRLVLGSVAEQVLHHAHVPVLCFPSPE